MVLIFIGFYFRNVLSIDEYASYFDGIDPLSPYKTWKTRSPIDKGETGPCEPPHTRNVFPERVEAAFVVSDPVDWGRDIQVLQLLYVVMFYHYTIVEVEHICFTFLGKVCGTVVNGYNQIT